MTECLIWIFCLYTNSRIYSFNEIFPIQTISFYYNIACCWLFVFPSCSSFSPFHIHNLRRSFSWWWNVHVSGLKPIERGTFSRSLSFSQTHTQYLSLLVPRQTTHRLPRSRRRRRENLFFSLRFALWCAEYYAVFIFKYYLLVYEPLLSTLPLFRHRRTAYYFLSVEAWNGKAFFICGRRIHTTNIQISIGKMERISRWIVRHFIES